MAASSLTRVKRAAAAKRRADDAYRAAIVAAVDELETAGERSAFATVAAAAGISRQAVRQLVDRTR
jgi:hypothetical protein